MKKFATMAISIGLIGTMVAGGSLAYLSDTASDVNVMTLGNVQIEQHEYERVVENGEYITDTIGGQTSYVLKDFTQGKPLLPCTEIGADGKPYNFGAGDWADTKVRMSQVKSQGSMQVFESENAQDKFVTVENTGRSDAYVRTLIAFESGSLTVDEFNKVIKTSVFMKDDKVWEVTGIGIVEVDGNQYNVYENIYNGGAHLGGIHENGVLPAGATTYPSLAQVYMTAASTNEDVAAIDGNDNGTYDILVLSQAVQTAGFADARTALEAGFGEATVDNVKAWFTGEEFTIPTAVATADELKAALAAGESVYLTANIATDKNETITIENNQNVVLNLNGHEITATANKTGNQELFLVKGNMTVVNGSMRMNAENNQEWNAMATLFDVTAGGVLNLDGVTANVSGTDMNFIVHLNNWGEATLNVNDCDFTATYVAVRAFNSGHDMNNVTIKNTDFHTGRAFWVHNYTSEGAGDSTLNLDIYGNGNTTDHEKPVRFGFSNAVYYDINGNKVN